MKNTLKEYYQTSDLSLATTISLFYPIQEIDKTDPRKASFSFKQDKKLGKLVDSYWRGELKVNPLAYFNELKNIKGRLYGEK